MQPARQIPSGTKASCRFQLGSSVTETGGNVSLRSHSAEIIAGDFQKPPQQLHVAPAQAEPLPGPLPRPPRTTGSISYEGGSRRGKAEAGRSLQKAPSRGCSPAVARSEVQHENLVFPRIPSLGADGRGPLARLPAAESAFGAGARLATGRFHKAARGLQLRGQSPALSSKGKNKSQAALPHGTGFLAR